MTYRAGELNLRSMWSILGMPEPEVVPSSRLELTGPVKGWPRTLTRLETRWTFRKMLEEVGAYYVNPFGVFMLVVLDA